MAANTAPRTATAQQERYASSARTVALASGAAARRRRKAKLRKTGAVIGLSAAAIGGLSFISSGASADTNVLEETVVEIFATDSTVDVEIEGEGAEGADAEGADAAEGTEAVTADSDGAGGAAYDASLMAVVEVAEDVVEENSEEAAADSAPVESAAPQEQAPAEPAAAPAAQAPAAQAPAEQAPAQNDSGPTQWNVDVTCAGDQTVLDKCAGVTNYLPASKSLGVPYYAQHDYLGGNAWWAIQPGDTVVVEGTTYVVGDIRVVETGGSSEQIEDMHADAFLQTCLEDGVHSRVIALVRK